MILVDSSVWIDYLVGRSTAQVDWLDARIDVDRIAIGDLILAEVLQGCDTDREFRETRRELSRFTLIDVAGDEVAVEAAGFHRSLRSRGVTVRKTIDTLIATRCILDDIPLLYADRDFDPFVQHLGLRSALDLPTGAT